MNDNITIAEKYKQEIASILISISEKLSDSVSDRINAKMDNLSSDVKSETGRLSEIIENERVNLDNSLESNKEEIIKLIGNHFMALNQGLDKVIETNSISILETELQDIKHVFQYNHSHLIERFENYETNKRNYFAGEFQKLSDKMSSNTDSKVSDNIGDKLILIEKKISGNQNIQYLFMGLVILICAALVIKLYF